MGNSRTRFRVRESTVKDITWDVDKAIDMWQRMLSKRLQDLLEIEPENQFQDERRL